MMKFLVASLVVAVVICKANAQKPTPVSLDFGGFTGRPFVDPYQPFHQSPLFRIVQQRSTSNPSGYQFSYETENQIRAEEVGEVLADDPYEDEHGFGTHARGHYEYVDPEGNHRAVDWIADDNGYRTISRINGQLEENQFGGGPAPVDPYLGAPIGAGPGAARERGPLRAGPRPVGLGAGAPLQVLIKK